APQHDVENDQVERPMSRTLERLFARRCDFDRVSLAGEPIAQRELQPGIIFGDQNSPHHAPGRHTTNVHPLPGVERTDIVPFCCSTRRFTMLSPRPLPGTWLRCARFPR